MKYPALQSWVSVRKAEDGTYHILDRLEEIDYSVDRDVALLAHSLNGRNDPYACGAISRERISRILDALQNEWLVKRSRAEIRSRGSVWFSLLPIRPTRRKRAAAFVLNLMLMAAWIPVLALGILGFRADVLTVDGLIPGICLGTAAGMILHEAAHAMAALAYGADVFEMGLRLEWLPGAYTLIKKDRVQELSRRIQIDLAGVEMNLLLCGVLMLLAGTVHSGGGMLASASMMNLLMAALNLLPIENMDGFHAVAELFGGEEALDRLVAAGKKSASRRELMKQGIRGVGLVLCSWIIRGLSILRICLVAFGAVNIVILLCM